MSNTASAPFVCSPRVMKVTSPPIGLRAVSPSPGRTVTASASPDTRRVLPESLGAGRVASRQLSDLDDFRSETLARQAEAEAAFHQGDPAPRMEMWSRRDPVTLFGAAGMYKAGWDELSRTFPGSRLGSPTSATTDTRSWSPT